MSNKLEKAFPGIALKSKYENIKKKNFSMNTVWNEQINRKNLNGFESKNKFIHLTNIDIYNYFLKDY